MDDTTAKQESGEQSSKNTKEETKVNQTKLIYKDHGRIENSSNNKRNQQDYRILIYCYPKKRKVHSISVHTHTHTYSCFYSNCFDVLYLHIETILTQLHQAAPSSHKNLISFQT